MIISKTPLRISLFGGGTDFPDFFNAHGGAVLGTTIDKYIYHSVLRLHSDLFDYRLRLAYSKIESVLDVESINHAPFREILKYMNIQRDMEFHVASDIPNLSGLGSSSAFTVGLLKLLSRVRNIDQTATELGMTAIHMERNVLKETVGYQDQLFAAHGGFKVFRFSAGGDVSVEEIDLSPDNEDELNQSVMLFYTGIRRNAEAVEREKLRNLPGNIDTLKEMLGHVEEALDILRSNGSLIKLGYLLGRTWHCKRSLSSSVSNNLIDEMYQSALDAGAIGGKLLGAGAGGFLLLYVPPEKKKKVRSALKRRVEIPIKINASGSSIIFDSGV